MSDEQSPIDEFAPEGGLYYKKNYEQSAGTVEFQDKVVHSGKRALRLSVKPLCPASEALCSERAEVWERTKGDDGYVSFEEFTAWWLG